MRGVSQRVGEQRAELFHRVHVVAFRDLVAQGLAGVPVVGVQSFEDGLFGLEVVVDRASRQVSQLIDDVLDGGLVVAFLGEQLFRGGEDAAFRHLGVRVACHGSSFRYVISIHTDSRYVYCVS